VPNVKREHYLLTMEYLDAVHDHLRMIWNPPAE